MIEQSYVSDGKELQNAICTMHNAEELKQWQWWKNNVAQRIMNQGRAE